MLRRPPAQLGRARAMRTDATKAEDIFWRSVRSNALGLKFRRQVPIGPYIADFACLASKLVVELDGPPHVRVDRMQRDMMRDAWFRAHGWRVLRVPNAIVFGGGDLVLDRIRGLLPQQPSSDPTTSGHPGSSPGQALLPQARGLQK